MANDIARRMSLRNSTAVPVRAKDCSDYTALTQRPEIFRRTSNDPGLVSLLTASTRILSQLTLAETGEQKRELPLLFSEEGQEYLRQRQSEPSSQTL
ncbi:hypothetical protein ACJ72_04999 [Emergomyces africanus]|uniref:Uncharacterized protein n=1 Tax=Emergomyces africanus TaxID=1955775 RepID=A0A1B7NV53_9EURO|nr:hypothetical protein ACJ72_04999 [Emergomyces africanus]